MEPICWNGAARNGRASHFLNSYSSMRDIMCAKISLIYEADFIALRSQLTLPTKPTSSSDEVNSIFEGINRGNIYRKCRQLKTIISFNPIVAIYWVILS